MTMLSFKWLGIVAVEEDVQCRVWTVHPRVADPFQYLQHRVPCGYKVWIPSNFPSIATVWLDCKPTDVKSLHEGSVLILQ